MPDIIKSRDQVNRKNKDLNDGTYAEVVSVENFGAALTDVPTQATAGMAVRPVGQMVDAAGFGASGSSILDEFFSPGPAVSGGVTFNQASGALNIVAGTTANGEFLARSVKAYRGSMRMRHTIVASQRIANNNLAVMLADLIGENVIYTINSSTSVTIFVGSGENFYFDQTSIGQSVNVGGILGDQGVPGRYPIAAVQDGVSITLTVSGWPASGGGTCTVFGLNYIRNLFTGTTATNVNVDAQRRGWATNDTVATINTTASPGTLLQCELTGREVFWSDTLRSSIGSAAVSSRASRFENIPDAAIPLYVFVWNFNGPTAPASSTTWTLGSLSVENFANQSVYIQGNRSVGSANALPVNIVLGNLTTAGTPAVPATPYFVNSAASTNGALVITGTSGVCAFWASNIGASAAFVKLYNKATAPTVGTDIPEMIIPVNAAVGGVPGVVELSPGFNAHRFPLGLGIAITGGAADSDTTAVAAGQVKVKLSRTV